MSDPKPLLALAPLEKEVVNVCGEYARAHGWAISHRELADRFCIGMNEVVRILMELDAAYWIEYRGDRQIKVNMMV